MLFPSWLRSRTSRSPRAQTRRPALRRAARPLSLEQLEDRNLLSAYMVTTTADNGDDINPVPGSLRYAITQVNAGLYNEIDFNITSGSGYNSITGVATIRPPTELPPIANTVFINGYTQAGSSENNLTVGDNAVLRVELDGSLITPIPWLAGLTITADESVVQGLDIHSFYSSSSPSPGTFPSMGIWLQGGTHNHVQGNFIGTDVTGTSAPDGLPDYSSLTINGAMSYGVQVSDGANNNWIGAESRSAANDAAERNVISATGAGVVLRGLGVITSGGYFVPAGGYSNNNVVAGNYIGTDHTGTDALGNWAGIVTLQGTYGDRIGTNGTDAHAAGEGNLISANAVGISFGGGDPNFAAESSALVAGNVIGLNSQGNPLGNLAGGIGASEGSNNITIGGTSSVLANTIAGNDGPGIWVGYLPYFEQNQNGPFLLLETATGIRVQGNSIHDNDGLGIDLGGIYSFNGPDGVTLNGSQTGGEYNGFQTESAPNYWREFPSVTSASSGSSTVVSGTLNGPARTTFTVDVYANPNENASDYFQGQYYGEGQYYLGHATVTTDANGNASFSADFSAANLPGGGLPSGWFISATATDRLGDTSEFSADVTTAPAAQTFSQYLQATLPQNSSDPTVICVQVGPDQTPATVIAAVNGLTNVTLPVTIIYDLGGGTYSTGGVAADPPANVTFVVQNGTLDPASPALTVAGGQISVVNCTLTTSGDAPALLVTGGSVTLSNDNIVQESAVYTEPAISVTGGTVSLGTAANPGDNTLSVNSSGDLVSNTSGNAISVVGDTFEVGGAVLAAPSLSFTAVTSSPATTIPGQTATFTATIRPDVSGSTTPTGSVDFYDTTTGADLGKVTLSGGVASLSTSGLALGPHVIQASYSGDSNYLPSLATVTQTVIKNTGVLLLDPTGQSLKVSGNAALNVNNYGVVVIDSSNAAALTASGNASITATEIDIDGGLSTSGSAAVKGVVNKGATPLADPLASLAAPSQPSTTFTAVNYSGTLQPGTYVGGITVSGNSTVTLSAGTYYLTGGGLTVSGNAKVSGTAVLIYITGLTGSNPVSVNLSANASVTLSPPTSGAYQGVVLFQNRTLNAAIDVSGNAALNTTGTEYAAAATVNLTGNDDDDNPTHTSLGSQWIVSDLVLSGNATFSITADANNRNENPNALMVAGGPATSMGPADVLTTAQAMAAVQEAIVLWAAAGLDAATLQALAQTRVVIAPLPAPYLGLAAPGVIYLDPTAAGYGWFTDASPTAVTPAGSIDLLTVVSHELGHEFGLMDGDGAALMPPTLAPGVRILPDASDLAAPHIALTVSPVRNSGFEGNLALDLAGDVYVTGSTGVPGQPISTSLPTTADGYATLAAALLSSGAPAAFVGRGTDDAGATTHAASTLAAFMPASLAPAEVRRPFLGDLAGQWKASDGAAEWSAADLALVQAADGGGFSDLLAEARIH